MKPFAWEKIVIRDTEYTSWEWAQARHWSWPNEFREIVQIGAVMVNTTTREEISSFSVLITPTKNPLLSKFFIDLTKITQEEIDTQWKDFFTALKDFTQRTGERDSIDLYSWGWDGIILAENCGLYQIPTPFRIGRCKNIVDVFLENGVPALKYNSCSINTYFDIPNDGTEHNALADARNILMSLRALYKNTLLNLSPSQ